jgi:gliding motility-associated-like protein
MAHFERAIQIKVKDFPDSPISISLSSTRVYEDLPAGTFIAIISTGDDIGPPYSYTFSNTGTNDNSSFIISNDTLNSGALFDFEIKNLYAILITSTNSKGHALTKPFSISIRDTLDTPTDMAIDNALISENMPVHIRVGVLSTRDDNGPNAAHAYTFVTGPGSADNASFSISNDTLFSNSRFDFESRTTYQVRIRSTLANNLFFDKAFAVNVTEGADTITNILISKNTIYQNRPANTIIGKLTTISQDTADLYTYAFDNSVANDNASFFLSPNGLISSTQSFDFEVKSTYLISVKSSNVGGTSFVKQLNILVKDTLETPTDLLLSDSLVADNKPGHTYIGKLATVDENGLALHAYTLVSGIGSSSDSSFTIGHDSLFIKSVADFESRATYSIRVRSTLVNGMNFEKAFHVYVTTKGEGPHAHADSLSVKENAKPYYITTVTASDSDANATLHYKLLTTGVPFTMDSSGKLSLSGALNYQTNKRYVLSFSVSDELSPANHDSALVIVTVLPVAEAILPINNYVSPNGDGKNDYLVIQNADVYREYELTIYNSNGMVVLKTNGYDNSWNGSGLDAGVYYYTFFGSTKYKGNITLVK